MQVQPTQTRFSLDCGADGERAVRPEATLRCCSWRLPARRAALAHTARGARARPSHETALRRPNYARPARAPPPSRPQQKDNVADAPDGFWRLRFLATRYAQVLAVRGMEEHHRRATRPAGDQLDAGLRRLEGWFGQLLDLTLTTEQEVRAELVREYRRVAPPEVRAWQQATPGIGELGLARLLGHVGHPVHAVPYHWEGDGPARRLVAGAPFDRSIRQLWAYCGHGWAGRPRSRLMTADELWALGQPVAKRVVRWMATGCQRQVEAEYPTPQGVMARRPASPYRTDYVLARDRYGDRRHAQACPRCGPRGQPAPPGSPWTPGHQHAAALRLVGKTILRDLWLAAWEPRPGRPRLGLGGYPGSSEPSGWNGPRDRSEAGLGIAANKSAANVEPENQAASGESESVTFAEIARRVVDQLGYPSMSRQRVGELAATDPDWPVPRAQWRRVGAYWLVPWPPVRDYFANRRRSPSRRPRGRSSATPAT